MYHKNTKGWNLPAFRSKYSSSPNYLQGSKKAWIPKFYSTLSGLVSVEVSGVSVVVGVSSCSFILKDFDIGVKTTPCRLFLFFFTTFFLDRNILSVSDSVGG